MIDPAFRAQIIETARVELHNTTSWPLQRRILSDMIDKALEEAGLKDPPPDTVKLAG